MSQQKKGTGAAVKAGIVIALAVVVGAIVYAKQAGRDAAGPAPAKNSTTQITAAPEAVAALEAPPEFVVAPDAAPMTDSAPAATTRALPRLVDLGAGKCIPCKMMAPILEELRRDYKDRFEVVFLDVWENPNAGKQYGIRMIPTQIFYDAAGQERFRHEGFFSKEDILAKWKQLGVNL